MINLLMLPHALRVVIKNYSCMQLLNMLVRKKTIKTDLQKYKRFDRLLYSADFTTSLHASITLKKN